MSYEKERVKEQIELEDVYNIIEYFDGEPQMFNSYIVSRTICHQGDTHKLYYYDNTKLFKCYTGDCGAFDIFELIQKIQDVDLNTAVYFVVNFLNLQSQVEEVYDEDYSEIFTSIRRYNKIANLGPVKKDEVIFPEIPNYIKYHPQPRILNWEKEGINYDICKYMDIHYDPVHGCILIPHRDMSGRLIGIRQRTLVTEDEVYGKYRPARLLGQLCNHPLAFNLYGLDKAKENIANMKVAIVVESEKAVLQYISYFGTKSNICVAVCGSSLSDYQFQLLKQCGMKELVIGFDKDFQELNTEEHLQLEKKLLKIYDKYNQKVNLSFLFDLENNTLGYKDSPLDCGKEAFLHLWRNRIPIQCQ